MSNEVKPVFEQRIHNFRKHLGNVADMVKSLHQDPVFDMDNYEEEMDYGEMHENIILVYRHLEDARMRLGKVVQAANGGISILDK